MASRRHFQFLQYLHHPGLKASLIKQAWHLFVWLSLVLRTVVQDMTGFFWSNPIFWYWYATLVYWIQSEFLKWDQWKIYTQTWDWTEKILYVPESRAEHFGSARPGYRHSFFLLNHAQRLSHVQLTTLEKRQNKHTFAKRPCWNNCLVSLMIHGYLKQGLQRRQYLLLAEIIFQIKGKKENPAEDHMDTADPSAPDFGE